MILVQQASAISVRASGGSMQVGSNQKKIAGRIFSIFRTFPDKTTTRSYQVEQVRLCTHVAALY